MSSTASVTTSERHGNLINGTPPSVDTRGSLVNDPTDLGVLRDHLPELQRKAPDVNRRLVNHERLGQTYVLTSKGEGAQIVFPTRTPSAVASNSRLGARQSPIW